MEALSTKISDVEGRAKADVENSSTTGTKPKHPHTKFDTGDASRSERVSSLPSFFVSVAELQPGQHNVNCLVRVLRLLIASSQSLHPLSGVSAHPFSSSSSLVSDRPSPSSSSYTYSMATSISIFNIGNSDFALPGARGEDNEGDLLIVYEFLVADQTGSVKLVLYDQSHYAACKVGTVIAVVNAIASVVDGEVFLEVLGKAGGKVIQTSLSAETFPVSEVPSISDVPVTPLRSALLPANPGTS